MSYSAPLKDMEFVLNELAGIDDVSALPGFEDCTRELATAVLAEADKFATGVLSPLNVVGDRQGARWLDGAVSTAPGWREAYSKFVANGWNALPCRTVHGGQGLPRILSAMVEEMWNGANVAFALCPMLTRGAIEVLEHFGNAQQQSMYLPKMVSGEWTGTMNLTEPQAGSDLAAVRTRAVPQSDGSYRVHGQKIFITYGEHDLTDNIVHLVLARTPDAPEGVKGISLFVVPKFLVRADGTLGERNDVRCASIEHKLGIHGSPTAVLAFGDQQGASGWLVGEERRGLEYMFTMMNAARYAVGLEGIGLCEQATQRAAAYARGRIQGTEAGGSSRDKVAILRHPDVRRMLLQMKSRTEALRIVASVVAAATDASEAHPDPLLRAERKRFVDLMIPIVKGWSTESAVLVTSLGVQVHGGMGFIEETGAAQHLRDARITPIYEGTTGIQAIDLIGRKVARDGGQAIGEVIASIDTLCAAIDAGTDSEMLPIGRQLRQGVACLREAVTFVLANQGQRATASLAGAVPFLELFGIVAGGWQMARAALAARRMISDGAADQEFLTAKIRSARFYADHVLSASPGLAHSVVSGCESTLAMTDEQF